MSPAFVRTKSTRARTFAVERPKRGRSEFEQVCSSVRTLVAAVGAKDAYTAGHSDRVSRFAVRIAIELGCHPRFQQAVFLAGLVHDVGKIGIDDAVLRKSGRLTQAEFEQIKLHPEIGCRILTGMKTLEMTLPAVRHHHERWDGLGYPDGLRGAQIPYIARIMAVADAYDAMTSDRPYRVGLPADRASAILRSGSGEQWDPAVVAAFLAASADVRAIQAGCGPS